MEVAYLLEKLYKIDQALGGTTKIKNEKSDPF